MLITFVANTSLGYFTVVALKGKTYECILLVFV